MTKAIKAAELGLESHYKVRIIFHGSIVHVASRTEPVANGHGWKLDLIDGEAYGDSVGFINWDSVQAITWRYSP